LTQFGRHQCGKFCIGQLVAHDYSSLVRAPRD
jgi:hypothetical protein